MLKTSPSSIGISQTTTQQLQQECLMAASRPLAKRLRVSWSCLLSALGLPLFIKYFWLLWALDGPTQPGDPFIFLGAFLFITSRISPSSHAKYMWEENNKLLPLAQASAFPTHSPGRKVSSKGWKASAHHPCPGLSKGTISTPRVLLWTNLVPAVKIIKISPIYYVCKS